MANLGNAWHIPDNPEPRGRGGMRDPVGALVAGAAITILSGNQFQGAGNVGNQLQDGSSLFFKRTTDANWTTLPLIFQSAVGNNKYFAAKIPAATFQSGDAVQYYLRIAYDDHDTTFLHANGNTSLTTDSEATARNAPFAFAVEASAVKGQWEPVFDLPNVAIHTHLLPNGLVLMWGRRDAPNDDLDVHQCTPFLWNPATGNVTNTPQPTLADGSKVNLFCAGHAFLADGRLLVVGGHLTDGDGVNQAALYDAATNKWTPTALMNKGRWYPTATTLPDGSVLVQAGSYKENGQIVQNIVPQLWKSGTWDAASVAPFMEAGGILPLYPRLHVAADGRVFLSGANAQTYLLKTAGNSRWTKVGFRAKGIRDYCPAVMYDVDKVLYIGGGNDEGTRQPTADAEIIDLAAATPQWKKTKPMQFRRRQHNAVVLPDGTVLVTGGTRGGGEPNRGFNDLNAGQPVHVAELWNPDTGTWIELAAEEFDRCYHSTAVLLPDARVLSAGGGEYRPDDVNPNDPQDSHRNAQIFSPPYLFKGNRPAMTAAPATVSYGETFEVKTPQPDEIGKISWVRLPSVTHAFDQNQHINFLKFQVIAGKLKVTAPNSANICPPGHYMMFVLSKQGVPSLAKIIQISVAVAPAPLRNAVDASAIRTDLLTLNPVVSQRAAHLHVFAREAEVAKAAKGTMVVVGITGTCPYGLGACWGGAYEALTHLEDVDLVGPIPNADASTAEVFLKDQSLPALEQWDKQFRGIVNGTYELRGVEVTLQGIVHKRDDQFFLSHPDKPEVQLVPLSVEKIQWNRAKGAAEPPSEEELSAYEKLANGFLNLEQEVTVTGPLKQTGAAYQLYVRQFGR